MKVKIRHSGVLAGVLLLIYVFCMSALANASELADWDAATATAITFDAAGVSVSGEGAAVQDNIVIISEAGSYVLSGTTEDGRVVIDASKEDEVQLVLNGVDITCQSGSPVYAAKGSHIILVRAEGTDNRLADTENYQFEEGEDEPDATLFVKNDLTICGEGSLTVEANYRNGIAAKDTLTILGGNIAVTAPNDAMRGRDSVTVNGGKLALTAGNDGLKSNNDTDTEKGWIVIHGGEIEIVSGHDGIQAETALTVNGGSIVVTSGGGAQNAAVRVAEQWGRGATRQAQEMQAAETTDDDASTSQKGLKAGTALQITDGRITIDAADDAIHANGDVTIHGGEMALRSGDDGIHADAALSIGGGVIVVEASYEGIEGATVQITDGSIRVTASDDGINAAGGSDGEDGLWGRDAFMHGGSSDYWIDISGGSVWIDAGGDGLDSNGSLTISGGSHVVHGPTGGGNTAIDADGTISITGGTIISADGGESMQMPGGGWNVTQPTLTVYFTTAPAKGEQVVLRDAQGNELAVYEAWKANPVVLFSLPQMKEGETYTVVAPDGTEITATLQGAQTSVSQSGEAINAGGMGGGFGGRGQGGGRTPREGTPPDGMQQQPRPGEEGAGAQQMPQIEQTSDTGGNG